MIDTIDLHDETGEPSGLELDLQELEAMEAPGFWTGVQTSAAVAGGSVAAYGASFAVGVAVT